MIGDTIARQGDWMFRWRSYLLLVLAPLVYLAITQPEPVEMYFGKDVDTLYESIVIAIAFFGLGIRAFTIGYVPFGTSGRNTKSQRAESLNTTGIYSLTRNPLYFGNAVIYMAIALFTQNIWFVALMGLFLTVYLERIIAREEQFLADKFGETYLEWARKVPVFIPRLSGWTRPALPFSLRNVLRREYSGLFAIVITLFTIDSAREYLAQHHHSVDPAWLMALAFGAFAYVTLRWLKRNTHLLDVEGR